MADRRRLRQLQLGHGATSCVNILIIGEEEDGAWSKRLLWGRLESITWCSTCILTIHFILLIIIKNKCLLAIHRLSFRAGAPANHFDYLLLESELPGGLLSKLGHRLLLNVDLTLVILGLAGLAAPSGARVRLCHILYLLVLRGVRVHHSGHCCLSLPVVFVS